MWIFIVLTAFLSFLSAILFIAIWDLRSKLNKKEIEKENEKAEKFFSSDLVLCKPVQIHKKIKIPKQQTENMYPEVVARVQATHKEEALKEAFMYALRNNIIEANMKSFVDDSMGGLSWNEFEFTMKLYEPVK